MVILNFLTGEPHGSNDGRRSDRASYTVARPRLTRPDTRPSVADGWAGVEMRVFSLFNSMVTDGWTDQPTDGRTKPLKELRVRN